MFICHRVNVVLGVACLVALSTPASAEHAWGNYHWARNKQSDQPHSRRQPHVGLGSVSANGVQRLERVERSGYFGSCGCELGATLQSRDRTH